VRSGVPKSEKSLVPFDSDIFFAWNYLAEKSTGGFRAVRGIILPSEKPESVRAKRILRAERADGRNGCFLQ
jgi:hypothetical protein